MHTNVDLEKYQLELYCARLYIELKDVWVYQDIRLNSPGLGQALSPSTCESSEMSNTAFLDSVTSQPPALVGLARC